MVDGFKEMVLDSQSSEVTGSTVPVVTEEHFAKLRFKTIEFRGRFWRASDATRNLIHVPVCLMALIREEEASFPTIRSLGYRARVEGMEKESNGFLHVHILEDLDDFTEQRLKDSARRNIKTAVKNHKVSVVTVSPDDPKLLVEQGYEVLASSLTVNKYAPIPTKKHFLKTLEENGPFPAESLILAGLVGDRLGAYVTGSAVGDTAYLEQVLVSDEYKHTNVGSRVIYAFIEACQRTPGINQIVNWRLQLGDPGLTVYKEKMGFPVSKVPIVVKLRPPFDHFFGKVVRRLMPGLYFGLYGRF